MSFVSNTEPHPILIGGERSFAASRETLESTNPSTGESLGRFPRCAGADVEAAVSSAGAAAPGWGRRDPGERAASVQELADALERRADEFAEIDAVDNGSPLREMSKDVRHGVAALRYFAGLALEIRGHTIPTSAERLNYTLRQPYGVVARIMPFNHPLLFSVAKIAAPLVAGNTVIIKPSEHTSLSTLALVSEFARIFPPGVVNVLTGLGIEVGDALAAHPEIRRLAFTGSAATGRAIQQRAAAVAVKHVTLELGGKNPVVVLPDADHDLAVAGALAGMNYTWQGQSCGSTSRLLVHRDLHDEFVGRLVDQVGDLRTGLPLDPETQTGSMVNRTQMERVLRYISLGRDEGAKVVVGGGQITDGELARGLFVRPTVFTDVRPGGRLAQEEIFGPVLAVIKYDDYEDALRIANGVEYGLTASIYTRDLAAAHAFARDVQAGYVWVNETSRHIPGAPFGGVKDSGLGREEDLSELESYTQIKNVHVRFA